MTLDEMIAVLEAAKAGKVIEARPIGRDWDFTRFEYRVKPKPREWWIAGCFPSPNHPGWVAYNSEREAHAATRDFPGTFVAHVREVLNDASDSNDDP